MMFFSHRISDRKVCADFCAPTCSKYSYTYKANFSLAWLSEGTTAPLPLAYMLDSVLRLLPHSTPVKESSQENAPSP